MGGDEQLPLILASASPRRQDLLRQIGIQFEVHVSDVVEELELTLSPEKYVRELASRKALAIANKFPTRLVLGADTIVVLGDSASEHPVILNKPIDQKDAISMLSKLQDAEHVVFTGFCLVRDGGRVVSCRAVSSKVRFRPMDLAEIEAYVATGEPFDKAGGYGVQGIGASFIETIEGSYTNIVGLPLCELTVELKRCGVWQPSLALGRSS